MDKIKAAKKAEAPNEAERRIAQLQSELTEATRELAEVHAELKKAGAPPGQLAQWRLREWRRLQAIEDRVAIEEHAADLAALRASLFRKLPNERASKTHKFCVGGQEGYLTVGLYDDGTPGEMFLKMSRPGERMTHDDMASMISGLMDSFAIAVSIALRHGAPLALFVEKFSHTRFEPAGPTQNAALPRASSLVDYLFRWMALKYLPPVEAPPEEETP